MPTPSLGGNQLTTNTANPLNPNQPDPNQNGLNIQDTVDNPTLNTNQIQAAQMPVTSVQGGNYWNDTAGNALYQQGASRLDPRMEQEQASLENQLQQQGLTRGSSAWNAEMDRQMRTRNDAYSSLQNNAAILAGQEAARMQGMDINAGNFANQATQQNFTNQGLSQQWQNAALGQQFGQNLQAGQFGNAAQNQRQQAHQFAQSYDLQNRTQQAQMDQFAATMGMTGRQLDAQIDQWAQQNGISREQMANQLLMSREANNMQRAVATSSGNASLANAAANRQTAADALAFQQQQWQANMARQTQFDPYLLQNLAMGGQGASLGGNQLTTSQ